MTRLLALLGLVALVAAGCGVRNSKPFTAKASASCFRNHGFTAVSTNPGKVGFIAGFADAGGIRARSATGNVLTIAFTAGPDSVASTEEAFKSHAPKSLRPHISDIMSTNRNAVLVWTITPKADEADAATRCLKG
ncbi:MAG: hypothetical protein ABI553_08940 [Chloroflexota bacterium]